MDDIVKILLDKLTGEEFTALVNWIDDTPDPRLIDTLLDAFAERFGVAPEGWQIRKEPKWEKAE